MQQMQKSTSKISMTVGTRHTFGTEMKDDKSLSIFLSQVSNYFFLFLQGIYIYGISTITLELELQVCARYVSYKPG